MLVAWRTVLRLGVICLTGSWFAVCRAAGDEAPKVEQTPFQKSVAPLLAAKCVACHSGSEAKAGLDLTVGEKLLAGGESGAAVVPGKPAQSLIWQRVLADEMPPKHPLSAAEKSTIKAWIEAGAVWTGGALDPLKVTSDQRAGYDWWSLQPLSKTACPTVRDAATAAAD